MADDKHLARLLNESVDDWNAWRKAHPEIHPDLREANLTPAYLRSVDLSHADLTDADLNRVDLRNADLHKADLLRADLSHADLTNANLRDADLSYVNLFAAILRNAGLSAANLFGARLISATMVGADLTNTKLGFSTLTNLDLSQVRGLETVVHALSSSIGIDTIYLSEGKIPEALLRGVGLPDLFIEYMRSLVAANAIEYYSCFISY